MPKFEPDKSLLNPKFEGYKLDAIDQERVLARFALAHPLSQSSASGRSPLSFQEVQSRIRHNHLVVGPRGQAVYVDGELRVVRVTWDTTNSQPQFDVLYELPRVVQSGDADADGPHREYPSAAFADDTTLFVSDGHGMLYVLQLGEATTGATLLNAYEHKIPEAHRSVYTSVPFRVHFARKESGAGSESAVALLSSRHYRAPSEEVDETASARKAPRKSRFDVWAVTIDLNQVRQDQPFTLNIEWHRQGEDVPSYVHYVESRAAFMLLGSSPYRSLATPTPQTHEPTPDEIVPIPRPNENLDSSTPTGPPKPPPYSWTQSDDSVTVAFALPSDTPTTAIKATLSPTTLTIFIQSPSAEPTAVPLPRYALKKWWDGIHASTSFWTFDRSASSACGLLTLHLDKQHAGTRWPHVFADTDTEVAETLDPSELANIRQSLEKYTAALQAGEDVSGLGLGAGVPSLAEGEMDDEVDLDMGDSVFVTWVGAGGEVPPWSAGRDADGPVSVLATPLPTSDARSQNPSVVVKHGLDGVVYDLVDAEPVAWKHTATFCVLSFVLASKRDTRFVHHVSSDAVLAFESGARGLGSNVYIYRGTAHPKDKQAKQAVLKVGDASSGPLLGVGVLRASAADAPVLLCLCEREMAVIRDTLG